MSIPTQPQQPAPPQPHQPIDPSGISDHLHDLKKRGLPTTMLQSLLDYETAHRIC